MASTSRRLLRTPWRNASRTLTTITQPPTASGSTAPPHIDPEPLTHFKITLRRSAISLGDKIKGTLIALGLHRRMQTVYHRHTPEAAGKILRVKELVEVHNVPASQVMTAQERRLERKAPRGYKVVGSRRNALMGVGVFKN
ncbi:hypothetical protein C0989_007923 [Termitomyces sp. Mn162]|nr:hypothetical protein C0989_007923 [Termitomyces sp. Mn162]